MSSSPAVSPASPTRLHYAWVIVAITFLVLIAAAGVRSVPSVLIVPLEAEFGWSRATISLGVSINLLLYGLLGPFAAALMERIGMRRMMAAAFLILALSITATTQITQPWHMWLLWGGMVGLATGAMTSWISAAVANRWFVTRRGLVVGMLTAAGAMGQLIFLPLLASVVEAIDWRAAVLVVAVLTAVMIPLVALFVRNFPSDVGLLPYGASPDDTPKPRPAPAGNPFTVALATLRMAAAHRDFRLLTLTFFICGASTNGLIGTHLVPMSHDHGLSEVTGASLLAGIGVFNIAGTMGSGWLSDRYDNRRLLFAYYGLRGLSLLFLPFAFDAGVSGLALFAVFCGLDWVATVPPTVRLAGDMFGAARAGTVFAWMLSAHQVGAAMAAYGAGAMRTGLGDYQATFFVAGGMCLFAAVVALRLGHIERHDEDAGQRVPAPGGAIQAAGRYA